MIVQESTATAAEFSLLVKFAASYLKMLSHTGNDQVRLERIYGISQGGLRQWVERQVRNQLEKARALQERHGPFTLAGAGVDCAERLVEAGLIGSAKFMADEPFRV